MPSPFAALQPQDLHIQAEPSPAYETNLLKLAGEVGLLTTDYQANRLDNNRPALAGRLIAIFRSLINAANEAGITLEQAAEANLAKIFDRWPQERTYPPMFDEGFPEYEHLPRSLRIEVFERDVGNKHYVFQRAALTAHVDTLWIARDLGYRGGRRTGVPLTDEVHLTHMAQLFGGVPFHRATRGPIMAERTAAIVWQVIAQIDRPVLLWNVFPFHPHEPNEPFSNRCHTRAEREACKPLLMVLLEMVQPRQLIAIGRDAQAALADMGLTASAVRHPSYGGQAEFMSGLATLYGLERRSSRDAQLHLLETV